jgi:peroxiredoxin
MAFNLRSNLTTIILAVIVVLMGIEIMYLIRQNRRLLKIISNPIPVHQTLQPGAPVRPFSAPDLDGRMVAVDYGPEQPHRLLLWFSSACPACEDNLSVWNDLFRDFESEQLQLLGVCSDDPAETRALVAEYDLEFPVISLDDPLVVETYKGFSRPQTVLVGPEGRIRGLWPGSLGREQKESLTAELTEIHTLMGKGGDVQ